MDIVKINSLFTQARYEQRENPSYDVRPTQQRLRALVADEPDSDDKTWALRLADKLAEPLPPPPRLSALYDEAVAIQAALPSPDASPEDRYAALADAHHRIWEIADRADPSEEVHIRALTAPLQQLMDYIRPPTFGSGS
ncbi:hypothetical protein E1263_23020 [Kribbella antibiotica]|uniref:Uncharacterized protein n=1 Tax=Kribbella antibiotica TaxID=190195 RepID=A0A4R4ZG44_9ACTN|nr:hypothetical protein [Kribbella antibiotica]TDD57551.1 hypothetical protein E1263_23020 [Kribbella antibiotica]